MAYGGIVVDFSCSPGLVMNVLLSLMLQIYDDMVRFASYDVCMSMMRLGSVLFSFASCVDAQDFSLEETKRGEKERVSFRI